ncbi:MAG: MFS transporter [Bryobacterales bacterium]|nr:MFS transporter [Bryobacterales bacterium]
MAESSHKLAVREKMGYACGDIATNFFFQSMILYQTRYYTDTVGLSAVAVGSMFLILRLADAVFDPVIGALSDRTQTRWGSFARGFWARPCPLAWSSGWCTSRPISVRRASWCTPTSPTRW